MSATFPEGDDRVPRRQSPLTKGQLRGSMPWQVLEHTADVGLRATGEDLEAALADLLTGFGHLVCPEGEVQPAETHTITVEADNLDDLVVDLLDEVNFVHQMEGFIPCQATVELADGRLTATMQGQTWDRERHGYLMEIKATTYHALTVDEDPAMIEVIFDI